MTPQGCHSSHGHERKAGRWCTDGLAFDGETDTAGYRMVWVEDRMSRECRYDKRNEDYRCFGCENK